MKYLIALATAALVIAPAYARDHDIVVKGRSGMTFDETRVKDFDETLPLITVDADVFKPQANLDVRQIADMNQTGVELFVPVAVAEHKPHPVLDRKNRPVRIRQLAWNVEQVPSNHY